MKTTASLAQLISLCCVVATSSGQGTFQNLDFESATIVPILGSDPPAVQFGPAFPGWTGYAGSAASGALYNRIFLDSSGFSMIDDPSCTRFGCHILEGIY